MPNQPLRYSHCRHCGRPRPYRPLGLCWHCYYTPGVRLLHPTESKNARHRAENQADEFHGLAPLPALVCLNPPGSPEKIEAMCQRRLDRVSLFHPQDAGWEAVQREHCA
jgi:hypothetical protein